MKFHLTRKSTNRKTGPIPVSTSSKSTCPEVCPFKEKGCYGNGGPLRLHWDKVSQGERGVAWSEFLKLIDSLPDKQIWRHNQVGDLYGNGEKLETLAAKQLAEANKGKRGFTYTHYKVEGKDHIARFNASIVKDLNVNGFTVNLSANSPAHADQLAKLEIGPVTTTLPSNYPTKDHTFTTPAGRKGRICPAVVKEDMTCEKCGICALPMEKRRQIIGFPAHGSERRWVDEYIESS